MAPKGSMWQKSKSPYPQAHGNGGEALIGEARLIAATRQRLEALRRAYRTVDEAGITALRRKLSNTCAGAWEAEL